MKKSIFLLLFFLRGMTSQAQPGSYYGEIKSIITKNCVACHYSAGVAPFSLDNYNEVIKRKQSIVAVIRKGIMPPWRPDPAYTHFLDEKILSGLDRQKLIDWINAGCPKGIGAPENDVNGVKVGVHQAADLILKLPFTVQIRANEVDTNLFLEMPYEIDKDTFISSYEFVPDRNSGIHHVMIYIQNAVEEVSESDMEDRMEGEFWDGKEFHERSFSSRYLAFAGGWIPGQKDITMPDHMGFLLPKKGILIYQIHYGPTPVSLTGNFELRIIYSKSKPDRIVASRKYGTQSRRSEPYPPLVVPADSIMHFTLDAPITENYSIIAIAPHMHLLGKTFKAWLLKPNGDTVRLIKIDDWDFSQQGYYYPNRLIKAEKGTVLQAEIVMDNTSSNIRNPYKPPRIVKSGPNTRDEMIQLSIYVVPYRNGDEILSAKSLN